MSLVIFILILGILVLIHEFGHFIVAKKNNVKVEEFGFGLPPRIFGIKKGETLYSINLIPLGGFVKLFGEEYAEIDPKDNKKDKNRAFIYKKPWQKAVIIAAGVFMNLFLGVGIFYFTLLTNNFRSEPMPVFMPIDFKYGTQEKQVIIAGVNRDSPARKAKIQVEDVVLGYKSGDNDWQSIKSASEFVNLIKNTKDSPISFHLQNNKNGDTKTVTIIPIFEKDLNRYIIGVNLADVVSIKYQTPTEKLLSGFYHSYNLIDYNFKVISKLFSTAVKEKDVSTVSHAFSGPIGIFAVIEDTVKSSGKKLVTNLLNITGLLSLSLAMMNILPFPALDGGRMIFVIYEWVAKRRPNKDIERTVNFVGFVILILLGVLVSINDIVKFF